MQVQLRLIMLIEDLGKEQEETTILRWSSSRALDGRDKKMKPTIRMLAFHLLEALRKRS